VKRGSQKGLKQYQGKPKGQGGGNAKWVKGCPSPNPGGVRKEVRLGIANVMVLARTYTEDAVHALGRIVRHGTNDGAVVAAATALLDRAWGKPRQDLHIDGGVAIEHLPVSEAARLIREAVIATVSRNDEEIVHGRPLLPAPLRNGTD